MSSQTLNEEKTTENEQGDVILTEISLASRGYKRFHSFLSEQISKKWEI